MQSPEQIGRYRLDRLLGTGAFATVWLAHDPALDAPVAIKVLADNWAARADVRQRFADEARLLRRVESEHLVRVYDVGELPDGRPYLVMSHADRGCLADRLTDPGRALGPADVVRIAEQVAAGLAVLHQHQVVHRDLSAANVLLVSTRDGGERAVIADLGIAKDLGWASGLTQPAGTARYQPPEQRVYGGPVGPAADTYALGVLLGELLSAAGVEPGPGLAPLLTAAGADEPAARPSPAELSAAVRRQLAPAAAVPEVTGPVSGQVSEPAPGAARDGVSSRGRSRRPALAVLALVGLLTVGGAATLAIRAARPGSVVVTPDRTVAIRLPGIWRWAGPAGVPGAADPGSGATATTEGDPGARLVLAHTGERLDRDGVLAAGRPGPCESVQRLAVRALDGDGTAWRWTGCPDAEVVDQVALHPAAGGTVYLLRAGKATELADLVGTLRTGAEVPA
ncbi:MAG: protein kinase [Kineosporiaceae bacterium]|nr:protein kinase [Kineosporiaceae bacterium]